MPLTKKKTANVCEQADWVRFLVDCWYTPHVFLCVLGVPVCVRRTKKIVKVLRHSTGCRTRWVFFSLSSSLLFIFFFPFYIFLVGTDHSEVIWRMHKKNFYCYHYDDRESFSVASTAFTYQHQQTTEKQKKINKIKYERVDQKMCVILIDIKCCVL